MNAQQVLNDSMTVGELIKALQDFDEGAKVVFHYNYGDYNRTEVADPAYIVEDAKVKYSIYHNTLTVVNDLTVVNEDELNEYTKVVAIGDGFING